MNDLAKLVPKIIGMALPVLRTNCPAVQMVNRVYDMEAKGKGSTIDVPVPTPIPAREVVPSKNQPDATPDLTSKTVPITMDQWYEADFILNDREKLEVIDGIMPMSMQTAIASLGTKVNSYILGLYKKFYSGVGTPGTSPFANGIDTVFDANVLLTTQLAPTSMRKAIIDPFTHGRALRQPEFRDFSQSSDNGPIIEGTLGRKVGFDWFVDQNVPTHTAGTATGITTATLNAANSTSVTLKVASGTGTLVEGDILTFAGQTQQYRVVTAVTLTTGGNAVTIEPALKLAVDGSTTPVAVAKAGDHLANIMFHPMAIAMASRPLEGTIENGLGVISSTALDPVTNLVFRCEITRQNRQTRYAFDCLFGANVVRPELGLRLFG